MLNGKNLSGMIVYIILPLVYKDRRLVASEVTTYNLMCNEAERS